MAGLFFLSLYRSVKSRPGATDIHFNKTGINIVISTVAGQSNCKHINGFAVSITIL